MKRFLLTWLMLPLFSFIFSYPLFSQDITQWRGQNRDGIYEEAGLLKQWPEEGPEMLWHFDELGDGHSSAAVTDTRVFTAGAIDDVGYIFAFDHEGILLWKSEYGREWMESWDGVRSTPLIYDNKLYLMSAFATMVCMDPEDGLILWSIDLMDEYAGRNIKWGVTENLLIDGDKLFCTLGGEEANVIALDKHTGELIWKSPGNGEISAYGSPALVKLDDLHLLVTMTQNSILGIDASDGKVLWRFEHTNEWSVHPNTPLYHDGYLYCVSGYGKGGVLLKLSDDGSSVTEVWRNSSLDNQMGGVVLLDGRLYGAGHNNRNWVCLDWETGEELFSTSDFKRGNTIYADGLLYCYDERGKVGLIKPESDRFNIISSFEVPFGENQHWSHLVIHDRRLYVRHGTSLMVYDISGN